MIVVDTGVILAVADASDADHDRCDELLASHPGQLARPTSHALPPPRPDGPTPGM